MPNLPCGLPSSYHTSYWWLNDELPAEFFTRMLLCFSGETPLYHAESTLHYRLAMELWSLASERPRMFCPYLTMHDRSRTWIIPICPCARHQKQPPKRPLMNTLLQESTDPWTLPAFLTMWTVSNTANNRTGRRSRMRSIFGHRSSCKKFTINYS